MTKSQDITLNKFLAIVAEVNAHRNFVSDSANHQKFGQLRRRLLDLENLKTELKNICSHYGTESLVVTNGSDDGESDVEVEYKFSDVKEKMYEALVLFDELLEKSNLAAGVPSSSASSNSFSINVKLPTIELPKFSGNYTEWASFIETIFSLIDNNESLTDTQKLHYLKSCLEDEPKKTLEALKTHNQNYPIALNILKQRYENKPSVPSPPPARVGQSHHPL